MFSHSVWFGALTTIATRCRRQPESSRFVHRNVLGFITLDEVLRLFAGSMMHIALEPRVRGDLPDDESAYQASLRIPLHVITDFECCLH